MRGNRKFLFYMSGKTDEKKEKGRKEGRNREGEVPLLHSRITRSQLSIAASS